MLQSLCGCCGFKYSWGPKKEPAFPQGRKQHQALHITLGTKRGFPGGSAVKNLPAMQEPQETWVQPLGWEDPLEEVMETCTCILAWRIPWTQQPGRL